MMNDDELVVVVAPNTFKECLSAHRVVDAMRKGVLRAAAASSSTVRVIGVPLADGGDGTQELLLEQFGGEYVHMRQVVVDPLFRVIDDAKYALVDQGRTAVIEMAEASGLWRLKTAEKRCLYTTSYGFGQMIADCIRRPSVRKLILCIGGSATNDGGMGMAAALGYKFYDHDGRELSPIGGNMWSIARIDDTHALRPRADCEVLVACDVDNPLVGPQGATAIYGPQKGLQSGDADILERGLMNLATFWRRAPFNMADAGTLAGGGAAGGMGDGLRAFMGGRLVGGFDLVAEYLRLPTALHGAHLCITGEGALDGSSKKGKVPAGVVRYCQRAGNVPVVAIGGSVKDIDDLGVVSAFAIGRGPSTLEHSIANASTLIEECVYNIMRLALFIRLSSKL